MSDRIEELIDADLKILLAEYDRDLSIPHSGTKGSSREDLLLRFLKKRLPAKYGLDSGHFITADGQWSEQQDIIIYDRFDGPLFENLGHIKVIPIESVLVSIEVKSTLTHDELKSIFGKAVNTRSLAQARKYLAMPFQPSLIPLPLTIGFSFASSLKIEQINDQLRKRAPQTGVDILCVLRDPEGKAGYFLTHQTRNIMLLPEIQGESGNMVLRRFLFEILLHLQALSRFSFQPDLSAYLNVFGLDKLVRLQVLTTQLLHGNKMGDHEIIEMLYLMGKVPGISREMIVAEDSVFEFEKEKFENGTMNAEVWMYQTREGIKKPIYAKMAWEAANRSFLKEKALDGDAEIISAVIQWFRRMKEKNEKLIIKPEPDLLKRIGI